VLGDDDLVRLEHAVAMYRAIPDAELAVLPGTSHLVPMEKPELVNSLLLDFLQHDAVPTVLPIRRAVQPAEV
jgi:pimeloyl-ACP methyl ester carboxylesterase